jgi:exodeoxyribonuclease-3
LCGDFNIAPADIDVWDAAALVGATHVSELERKALQRLLDWGLTDVFRDRFPDTERLFSWWDYRAGNFHKGIGMRIDLVLASAPLAARVEWALIDRNARKGKLPSDHAPVVVQLASSVSS